MLPSVEDYGTPASGGQTIIKKITGAGQLYFNFNGEPNNAINMSETGITI